ncbi:MAG: hypothetical protein AB7V22_03610 [Kiritimatiellia bacterium]
MKTGLVLLVAALILLGGRASVCRASYVAENQVVAFTYMCYAYWAFIYDYTDGVREAATPGFVSRDYMLAYTSDPFDVDVAYLYDTYNGRYVQALALRNIVLF